VLQTRSTLNYLYGLQTFGIKLGLRNIRALLRFCNDPHQRFRSVHIAGTNGKGSTSAMIAAVLQAAGYRTGLYTSPHLLQFNERIRINGRMISDADLVRYTEFFRPKIDATRATFFEATTAIAFKYFADNKVDVAVVETGMGGRLDATNVLVPEVSVITSISKDHTQHLGNSLTRIAIEKGGIIKRGRGCVVGAMSQRPLQELKNIARQRGSELITTENLHAAWEDSGHSGIGSISMSTAASSFSDLRTPLLGRYQLENIKVAVTALEYLRSREITIPNVAVRRGIEEVHRLTGIRGRFEILRERPLVILDVGHNPSAVAATIGSLAAFSYRKLVLVFGVMKDKDFRSMIRKLASLKPIVFAVQPQIERALSPEVIAEEFRKLKCRARSCNDVGEGIRLAMRTQTKDDLLLVCGSHYVAGEALVALLKIVRRKSP